MLCQKAGSENNAIFSRISKISNILDICHIFDISDILMYLVSLINDIYLFVVTLCNRADHIYFHPVSFFLFFLA